MHDDPSPGSARRVLLRLFGLVQGVGVRAFVHRLAIETGLAGLVRYVSGGVEIEVEGRHEQVEAMLDALRYRLPPLARVDQLRQREADPEGAEDFVIVESVPYDRSLTTMGGFPLCPDCEADHRASPDRDFLAGPSACPVCSPQLSLLDGAGKLVDLADPLTEAQRLLREGRVLAVKGPGGYHLACIADCQAAVALLRRRKQQPDKPFAVMARDLDTVHEHCLATRAEARELEGFRRPILLLRQRPDAAHRLAANLAPGHRCLGVMLPGSPLHHLLVAPDDLSVLAMTSGNRSGEPMVANDAEALRLLSPFVDAFLVHDRPIASRCDDSLGFVEGQDTVLVRRSRGWVPLPVPLPEPMPCTLGLGARHDNVFTLTTGDRAFLSQYVGDTGQQDTLDFLEEALRELEHRLGVRPAVIAHGSNPDSVTGLLARRLVQKAEASGHPLPRLEAVQHHHAHLVSAMAAHGRMEPTTGLVLDGGSLGLDNTIWGGEILVGDATNVHRAGHLRALPLPGGEAVTYRPLRVAAAWLHAVVPEASDVPLALWRRAEAGEIDLIRRMVDSGLDTPLTSSAGRLFDVVSCLLGVADSVSYDGQAALELEQLALVGELGRAKLRIDVVDVDGKIVIDPRPLLRGLVGCVMLGLPRADLALAFHQAFAKALVRSAVNVRDGGGPEHVALCGGVFNNRILTRACVEELRAEGLEVLPPATIPVGDGGLSLGQVLVAGAAGCG